MQGFFDTPRCKYFQVDRHHYYYHRNDVLFDYSRRLLALQPDKYFTKKVRNILSEIIINKRKGNLTKTRKYPPLADWIVQMQTTDARQTPMPAEREITDFRITEAVRFIKSNFDRDLDFAGLAETLNLSASRLRHLFKQQTGISFRKYLRQERMNQARRLLETGFLTIKETARRSGITDTSHFVRDFENEFGLSPARYRKRYHSAEENRLPKQEI